MYMFEEKGFLSGGIRREATSRFSREQVAPNARYN